MQALNFSDIFLWTGIVATVLFIIKMAVYLVSGGLSELSIDFNSITETDTSFNFLSIEAILSFFMGLGWVGFVFYKIWSLPLWFSILGAIVFGIFFAALYAFLMLCVKKLDESPKIQEQDYLNAQGKAYTTIAPQSEGQAELTIKNQLSVINVFNATDEHIDAFTSVKVCKVENSKVFIEKA